jgi:hypothetical protein
MWYNPTMIDIIIHVIVALIGGLIGYAFAKKTQKRHASRVHKL